MAEQFSDVGGGITLCFETFGDPSDTPVLLVMGLGTQMLGWDEDFCGELAERGYFVVRFDNRDVGRSTHVKGPQPTLRQMITRRNFAPAQYSLADLADDAVGLMRALGIEPAHVVGASMGGMIAQTIAARHPESVRSLVSIMSNTGNRWKGQPGPSVYRYLLADAPKDRDAYVDRIETVFKLVGSTGFDRDLAHVRELAGRSYDRDDDRSGFGRQMAAIAKSADRTAELANIKAPTVVIHGTSDKMVRPSGGRATAKAIPGAKLVMIEGMGHDLPRGAWPQILDAIEQNAKQADGVRQAAA
jgi:pimeloyl-ACP methyl ester carboxylesterase